MATTPQKTLSAVPVSDDIGEAKRLEMYRLQVLLREAEQRANDLFLQNLVRGTSHLSLGQEAIGAGCAEPAADILEDLAIPSVTRIIETVRKSMVS